MMEDCLLCDSECLPEYRQSGRHRPTCMIKNMAQNNAKKWQRRHSSLPLFLRISSTIMMLFRPKSVRRIHQSEAKSLHRCQCHQGRVTLPDAQCSADLLGDHYAAQFVNSAYNACRFQMQRLLLSVSNLYMPAQ